MQLYGEAAFLRNDKAKGQAAAPFLYLQKSFGLRKEGGFEKDRALPVRIDFLISDKYMYGMRA